MCQKKGNSNTTALSIFSSFVNSALPSLRCAGCAAPPSWSHWLDPRSVLGGSGCHLGDGCGRAECRSPATAAASALEGCPLSSQRSL